MFGHWNRGYLKVKYKIKINFETEVMADSEENAQDEFFNSMAMRNEIPESFICNEMSIKGCD